MRKLFIILTCLWGATALAATAMPEATGVADTLSLNEVTVTAIKQNSDMRTQATALTVIGVSAPEKM